MKKMCSIKSFQDTGKNGALTGPMIQVKGSLRSIDIFYDNVTLKKNFNWRFHFVFDFLFN